MRELSKRPPWTPVFSAALVALCLLAPSAEAQTAAPSASPAPATIATPSPSVAAAPTPVPIAPPSALPEATPSPMTTEDQAVGNNGETITLATRPAATLDGKANRDDIFGAIVGAIKIIKAEMDRAGLKPAGRPMAVFLSATDEDFRYRVEIPIDSVPTGKTELSQAVKIGQTPIGKAMRFEHRGAYDDIDATYDAITAYVDEKGIDAQDVFIEEYMTDLDASDDPNTVVNIEVLLN